MVMRVTLLVTFFALSQASLRATPAAKTAEVTPLVAKKVNGHVQLSAEQKKVMHSGCMNACKPSPVESKCVTSCETAMYKCIDETGPNETPEDTKKCEDGVLQLFEKTKGIEKKEEKKDGKKEAAKGDAKDGKKEEKKEAKKEEKKASFLQIVDGDDEDESEEQGYSEETNAEVEGEDADEADSEEADSDEADEQPEEDDDSEESFVQVSRNIDDENAEAAEMARLEDESDKAMGEDADESSDSDSEKEEAADDEESFVQKSAKADDKDVDAKDVDVKDVYQDVMNDDDGAEADDGLKKLGWESVPDSELPKEAQAADDDDQEQEDSENADSFVQVSRNIDDENAEAAEMARLEDESDKAMGEDADEATGADSETEGSSDEDDSFVQVSRNIDDENAEAAEMARLEDESDKEMGEDADESSDSDSENDSSSEEDDSFVQVSRNIDDENAEAAEMARLEDESDKAMGEDADESSSSDSAEDEKAEDEDDSFAQTGSSWKPEHGSGVHLYEHPQGSTVVMPCPVEGQTSPESCSAYFGDKADGTQCPQISCPKALGVTMKLTCNGGCCPTCWAPDHVIAVDRHTSVDDAAVVDAAPQAPGSCGGVKCFKLQCGAGYTEGHVNGACCYSCVPGR